MAPPEKGRPVSAQASGTSASTFKELGLDSRRVGEWRKVLTLLDETAPPDDLKDHSGRAGREAGGRPLCGHCDRTHR